MAIYSQVERIKKIIREAFERAEIGDLPNLDLDGFVLVSKKNQNGVIFWKYSMIDENYIFNIVIANKNSSWSYKLFIYWKALSKKNTIGKGKDFEIQYGSFDSVGDLLSHLKRTIKNNNLFNPSNYHDNNKTQLDDEIFRMIEELRLYKDEIKATDNSYFKDLKKILDNLLDSRDRVKEFLDKNYPDEEDKQLLLLVIQKIHKLRIHNQIDGISKIAKS